MMNRKDFFTGIIIGILIGAIVTFGILWYWDTYQRKSKFERAIEKFQSDTHHQMEKAKDLLIK